MPAAPRPLGFDVSGTGFCLARSLKTTRRLQVSSGFLTLTESGDSADDLAIEPVVEAEFSPHSFQAADSIHCIAEVRRFESLNFHFSIGNLSVINGVAILYHRTGAEP